MKKQIKEYWPLLVPIIVVVFALFFWLKNTISPTQQLTIGMVEADYVDVASEIPGRLKTRSFKLGDSVKRGQIIAEMKPKELDALTGQSQAAVDAAEAQLELLKEGSRKEEKDASKNVYLIAKDQYELAKKTWLRMDALYKDSVIAGEEHDLAEFKFKSAKKEMNAAKARYDILLHGARPEAVKAAEALVEQAKSAHSFTSTLGENLEIIAPCNGIISSVGIDEGEVVMAGYPLATIQKEGSLHVVLQIKQELLHTIKKGILLEGTIPGITEEDEFVKFKIVHLNVMLDYADWVPTNQRGSFDLKTFEVHLEPVEDLPGLLPGMTIGFKL
jgi:HlyD family secretion protein